MKRLLLLTLLALAAPAAAQVSGDILYNTKNAGAGSTLRYFTPSTSTDLLGLNGSGLITRIPQSTFATASHTQAISTITGLQTALDDKASITGTYSDPAWLTGLAWSKLGSVPAAVTALGTAGIGNGVLTGNGSAFSYTATSSGGNFMSDAGKLARYDDFGNIAASLAFYVRGPSGPTAYPQSSLSTAGLFFFESASNFTVLSAATMTGGKYVRIPAVGSEGSPATLISNADTGTVTNAMLAGSIALSKLAQGGATSGQAIAWNGTAWAPTTVSSTRTGVYRTIWLPAAAGIPRTTAGCGIGSYETSTNRINYDTLEFDASTDEHAQWMVKMPVEWNGGTLKVKIAWTASSGSGSTYWELRATAFTNDDLIDTALGTAATTNDALIATTDWHETSATGTITVANNPVAGDYVVFNLSRDADNASDNLAADALVLGITVQYQESATEPSAW